MGLKKIRKRFKETNDSLETVEVESFTKAFLKTKKPSNLMYRNLVATKSEKPRASQTKWERDCDLDEDVCLQIPFCISLQLKVMIFAPFAKQK